MAISIDWGNKIIHIPKSYLTQISGTLYELDSDQLRKDLLDLQDDEEGITHPDTHRHNPSVTISGVTYAQTIEIINGYKLQFEDGQYTVKITGSNNNFADVEAGIVVRNQVSLVTTNSAGLIVVTQGSGVTEQDKLDIADRVWDELIDGHTTENSLADIIQAIKDNVDFVKAIEGGRWKIDTATKQMIFYEEDNVTEIARFNLYDENKQPAYRNVFERERV